jgi:hypothetical protein
VLAGYWKQHELWDGTYTLDDLADIHEVMVVKNHNEKIIQDYYKAQAEAEGRR